MDTKNIISLVIILGISSFIYYACGKMPSYQGASPELTQMNHDSTVRELTEKGVKARLKDPDSAKFSDTYINGNVMCGYVNSKNSYGGYGGNKAFIGTGETIFFQDEVKHKDFMKLWDKYCS